MFDRKPAGYILFTHLINIKLEKRTKCLLNRQTFAGFLESHSKDIFGLSTRTVISRQLKMSIASNCYI